MFWFDHDRHFQQLKPDHRRRMNINMVIWMNNKRPNMVWYFAGRSKLWNLDYPIKSWNHKLNAWMPGFKFGWHWVRIYTKTHSKPALILNGAENPVLLWWTFTRLPKNIALWINSAWLAVWFMCYFSLKQSARYFCLSRKLTFVLFSANKPTV